jgi:hypothetical protein
MKLSNLFFACLLLLSWTTVLADPPASPVEQGVCFEPTGAVWIYGLDPVTGAYFEGVFEANHNDFYRFNKEGTGYAHFC